MEQVSKGTVTIETVLKNFQTLIVDDPRVGPPHISLYLAIVHFASLQDYQNPVAAFRKDLMKHAKICGAATYIKCLQELQEFGFVKYIPSFNPLLGSLFYLEDFET